MGIFRTKKVNRYSSAELEGYVASMRQEIINCVRNNMLSFLNEHLIAWAEWYEAMHRKEKNSGRKSANSRS